MLNLTKPQQDFLGISAKELYTPSFDLPGAVYEDLNKRKRVMRADELYKFSDGTLKLVHDELHHKVLNFRLGYNKEMSRRKWSATDKRRSELMVELIDKQMRERHIIRNLERLVGAQELEMDYRLIAASSSYVQNTIVYRCTYAGGAILEKKTSSQEPGDLQETIPLDRIEVLRYDTKGVKVKKGIMQTKTELTLEQTQQGVSDEFLVSIEGVEE
ncbi:hypothetical protein Tco_1295512 [Tanacetum coccineum]